ncbi:MAG: 6-pyruvoyl tetrahydropterin synthase family protein [Thermoplasmata archaeon]|nr:MAG: 6-pyruvoyl tetrahydropterin synthase family protein [Thermoplasmata archaeon]MCD6222372.1 6-pyruvoyl tetrahydropterin synthase family protein [Thermoplasmata archaeon]
MEIRLDGWKLNLTFAAAHFIADYSKCSRLHGHSYAISVIVKGKAINGIVMDFVELKNRIRSIAEELDHKVLIPTKGDLKINVKDNEVEVIHKEKRFVFPKEDCAFIPVQSSSAENLASYILQKLVELSFPENVEEVGVGIDEGYGQGAWTWRKIK